MIRVEIGLRLAILFAAGLGGCLTSLLLANMFENGLNLKEE